MNFIKRSNRKKNYFSNCSFEIGCVIKGLEVITNTKFQLNICKIMPARPKQHRKKGC